MLSAHLQPSLGGAKHGKAEKRSKKETVQKARIDPSPETDIDNCWTRWKYKSASWLHPVLIAFRNVLKSRGGNHEKTGKRSNKERKKAL
jgi:hypothetical protein